MAKRNPQKIFASKYLPTGTNDKQVESSEASTYSTKYQQVASNEYQVPRVEIFAANLLKVKADIRFGKERNPQMISALRISASKYQSQNSLRAGLWLAAQPALAKPQKIQNGR